MREKFFFSCLFVILLLPEISSAQDTIPSKPQIDFKKEIIINYKRFRVWNDWVSGGAGVGYNTSVPLMQTVVAANFNFHIRQNYFRIGGMFSGDAFGLWNNYMIGQFCWIPVREETVKYNFALMGGISFSNNYKYLYPGHYENAPTNEAGIYAEVQCIRKIYYDAGIGPSVFVNVDKKNTIAGIRIDFYLSGAFRGYTRGHAPAKMAD